MGTIVGIYLATHDENVVQETVDKIKSVLPGIDVQEVYTLKLMR